jgi:signal peptidase I
MWPYLLGLATCALAAGLALRLRLTVITVTGDSMMPALAPGDRVLLRRAGIGSLRRGQVVVVEMPDRNGNWDTPPHGPVGSRRWIVKRVAALPGDPWPQGPLKADAAGPPVPPDGFALLGDNAAWSVDSREFGCVPSERLLGIFVCKLPRNDLDVSEHFHKRHSLMHPDRVRSAPGPDTMDSQ